MLDRSLANGRTRESATLGSLTSMRGGMVDLFLTTVFINVLSLAMPLTLLQVYDRIIPSSGSGTLVLLIIGVGSALLLEALLRIGRSYVSGWMGARFDHLAGCAAIERLLNTSISEFERHGSGVHLERFNALSTLREFYSGQALLAICDLPFAFLYLGVVGYLAGWLVWVPIVLIGLFAATAIVVGNKLRAAIEGRMLSDERRFNFIIEVLGGIHTVKGMAMEEQMLRRYERLQETSAEADYKVAHRSAEAISIGTLFSQLTMFVVVGFGATLVIDGALTVGGLAACTMLSGRAMQPLQKVVGIWTRFQTIRLARERVQQIFDIPFEAPPGLPRLPPVRGEIELRDVSFGYGKNRYGEELPAVLKNLNFHAAAGETVAVCGGNASGKTSLMYLMMAALSPTAGKVLIDGNDISQFDPVSVRSQIAYLPQEAVLFNGTILENLTMFRREHDDAALEMAKMLGLDNVVAHMPLGYDTVVGDGATDSLPRGIKQRVAIARALVHKPRVLLFDEANTAMDSSGDAMLRHLLERLKGMVTLVLVTHRPSVLSLAERIYDIKDGTLVERPSKGTAQAPRGTGAPALLNAPAAGGVAR